MHTGTGRVVELILADGRRYGRLACPEHLIPAPGKYLLASNGPDLVLPVPIFYTDSAPGGFIAPVPASWMPGAVLFLRGPLGRGFSLPTAARKVGLIALDGSSARLRGLIPQALKQNASVVLVCDSIAEDLPDEVEIQPILALEEILRWADFVAIDVQREEFLRSMERLRKENTVSFLGSSQILIHTPMPCGGIADCGVCAVVTRSGWAMACKDGPVFDWKDIKDSDEPRV